MPYWPRRRTATGKRSKAPRDKGSQGIVKSQPGKQNDLHGSAPDNHRVALLLVDVINTFEYPRGEELLRCSLPIARPIAELKRKARHAGVPVIYVNDNFGRWRSGR